MSDDADRKAFLVLVENERIKQIERRGWTPEHDAHHGLLEWCDILLDEIDDARYEPRGISAEQRRNAWVAGLTKVAAVCCAAYEALRREECSDDER